MYDCDIVCACVHLEWPQALPVAEYWIVDPVRSQITLLSWVEGFYDESIYAGDMVIKSGVIPEIEINLSDILG